MLLESLFTEKPLNPMSSEEDIIRFLFNPKKNQQTLVVNFSELCSVSRYSIRTLEPKLYLISHVIDAVAYMLTLRTKKYFSGRWFFPAFFSQLIISEENALDEHLIKLFFVGEDKLTNDIDHLQQLYIPINDFKNHWYLGIIDFDARKILICDTLPSTKVNEHRKNLIKKIVRRVQTLFEIWQPSRYKLRNIDKEFTYETPSWVPKQQNGYDCGVYVCLMMMYDCGMQKILHEAGSISNRRRIARMLYSDKNNKIAWPMRK